MSVTARGWFRRRPRELPSGKVCRRNDWNPSVAASAGLWCRGRPSRAGGGRLLSLEWRTHVGYVGGTAGTTDTQPSTKSFLLWMVVSSLFRLFHGRTAPTPPCALPRLFPLAAADLAVGHTRKSGPPTWCARRRGNATPKPAPEFIVITGSASGSIRGPHSGFVVLTRLGRRDGSFRQRDSCCPLVEKLANPPQSHSSWQLAGPAPPRACSDMVRTGMIGKWLPIATVAQAYLPRAAVPRDRQT